MAWSRRAPGHGWTGRCLTKPIISRHGWLPFSFDQAGLAQLVEQLICNHQVAGSIPAAGTISPSAELRYRPNCRENPGIVAKNLSVTIRKIR